LATPKGLTNKTRNDEINVSAFKEIEIHFTGDTYLLAVWIAMSGRARSTPTRQAQTTLHGLASKFVSAYGIDYSSPLSSDDVMAKLRGHGIKGNPRLRLEDEDRQQLAIALM
jgi:hypothetical protein